MDGDTGILAAARALARRSGSIGERQVGGKRSPMASSFGPVSGLTPVKLRWSEISITSPAP